MKTAENITQLHNEAMKLAQKAILALDAGNRQKAIELYEEAFEMEKQVALSFLETEQEPARSVYFRSAASLAMNCKRLIEAKELIRQSLSGRPPMQITEELLSLFEEITEMEVAEMFQQKRKELDEFMKTKTKELKETMRQARAVAGY
jgi:tetratricopeptide (TPR) repeat protein